MYPGDEGTFTELHYAVVEGDPEKVKALLKQGAEVNVRRKGGTALLYAINRKNEEIALLLLEHGAQLYKGCITRWVIQEGLLKVMNHLWHRGDDIHEADTGDTSLHRAAYLGNVEMAEFLIGKGARPQAQTCDGSHFHETPLHMARSREMAEILVDHGAWINASNTKHRVVKCRCERDMEEVEGMKRTPLLSAVKAGNRAVAELLIRCGSRIYGESESGFTLLHLAALHGSSEVIDLLISVGLEVNGQDDAGNTAFHYMARADDLLFSDIDPVKMRTTVDVLLKHGAAIDKKNEKGWTPLLGAISYNNIELAKHLIKRGCDVNARTHSGSGCVSLARAEISDYSVEKEFIEFLKAHGARE